MSGTVANGTLPGTKYICSKLKSKVSIFRFCKNFWLRMESIADEDYSMFHVTWTTFKFNRNQLGTVSAFVMASVPWSNQRAHQVIGEKLLSKEFHCRTKDQK